MSLIELQNAAKDYALGDAIIHALRGVSLSVEPGELLSVMGPSGCGKTTLLNLMGCIDAPTQGRVLFGGRDVGIIVGLWAGGPQAAPDRLHLPDIQPRSRPFRA